MRQISTINSPRFYFVDRSDISKSCLFPKDIFPLSNYVLNFGYSKMSSEFLNRRGFSIFTYRSRSHY